MTEKFSDNTDVFVSYRRKDVEFTKVFVQSLQDAGKQVWIDWEDIPPASTGFSDDIKRGLEGADALIAILTPDYLESTYCVDMELRYALSLNKRVIPVVLKKFDDHFHLLPEEVGSINWIYFTPHAGHENTYEEAMPKVIGALDTDLEHVRTHKRYLVRALEWDANERDPSYLFRGQEIAEAETWLVAGSEKEPHPLELHQQYILASRELATKRQRQLLTGVTGALVVTILLAIVAVFQWQEAGVQRDRAITNEQIALTNEAQAIAAEATAVRNFEVANSIALASGALDLNTSDRVDAVGLARESVELENPPLLAQRVFADVALQPNVTRILEGHNGWVRGVAYSPTDANILASGAEDNQILIWDVSTGDILQTLAGHTNEINNVVFSPDGTQIASAGRDQTIILWDAATGEIVYTLMGHEDRVNDVAFSPDGAQLASAGRDGVVKLWNTATGEATATLTGHDGRVFSVAFSPDGTQVLSGANDNLLKLWDVETGESLLDFVGHNDTILQIAYSPNGEIAVSASSDGTAILWDATTGEVIEVLGDHTATVRTVAFSPDGNLFATGSDDLSVLLWSSGGDLLDRYVGQKAFIRSLAFSPDSAQLAVGDTNNAIALWRVRSGSFEARYQDHTARVNAVAVHGDILASASDDTTVTLRDLTTDEITLTFDGHTAQANAVSFNAGGDLALSSDGSGVVLLWNTADGEIVATLEEHSVPVFGAALSPDATQAVSGGGAILADPELFVWDVAGEEILFELVGHTDVVRAATYSPDGSLIATAGSDAVVILWDAATGEIAHKLSGHDDWVYDLAFSPDGTSLLSSSADSTVMQWDVATGERMLIYAGHLAAVRGVAFAPSGVTFASAADDDTVLYWQVGGVEPIGRYVGHTGDVNAVTFGTDTAIYSGGEDRTVIAWRVQTLDELIAWVEDNVYIPEINCDLRRQLGIAELSTECNTSDTETTTTNENNS